MRQTVETSPTNLTMSIQFSGFPPISYFPAGSHPLPVFFSIHATTYVYTFNYHLLSNFSHHWVSCVRAGVVGLRMTKICDVKLARGAVQRQIQGKNSSQLHWIHENLKSFVTNLTLGFRVSMDQVHRFYIQIKSFFD